MTRLSKDTELGIDLLRGVAAVAVLLSHAVVVVLRTRLGEDVTTYAGDWAVVHNALGLALGVFWVWLFFVISGFCIHWSVKRELECGGLDVGRYALARVTRIYPLFLLGLSLWALGWWATAGWGSGRAMPVSEALGCMTMLQLWLGTPLGFQASWSLTNEMIYYAVWPLALALCGWQVRRVYKPLLLWIVAQVVVFGVLWKVFAGGAPHHWLIPFWLIPVLGVLWLGGAWLVENWVPLQKRSGWVLLSCSVGGLAWCLAALCTLYVTGAKHVTHFALALLSLLPMLGLLVSLDMLRLSRWHVTVRLCGYLGLLSYPCYILHHPVLWWLQYGWLQHTKMTVWENIAALCVVTLLLVGTVGVVLEKWVLGWRKGVIQRKVTA